MQTFIQTQEYSEIMSTFDRFYKYERLDKEKADDWKKGNVYQDGRVNALFAAFLNGYQLHKCLSNLG